MIEQSGVDKKKSMVHNRCDLNHEMNSNAAAKELFRRALGLPTAEEAERIKAWNRVCGTLPDDAADELRASLAEQRKIDWEMWK